MLAASFGLAAGGDDPGTRAVTGGSPATGALVGGGAGAVGGAVIRWSRTWLTLFQWPTDPGRPLQEATNVRRQTPPDRGDPRPPAVQRTHPGQVFHPRGTLSPTNREEDEIVRACIGLAALASQSGPIGGAS